MPSRNKTALLTNWKAMVACMLVSMSPFQYGIDFGLIGGIQAMVGFLKVFGYADPTVSIGWNISAEVQQLMSSLMTLGACVGSITAGPIGGRFGRRTSLYFACLLCMSADAIMLGTTNLAGLYAGRLLIGIANGWFMTFSQLYINECAPAHFRGLAMGFFQWWCSVGSLIGTVVDNFTANIDGRGSYMIPLALVYCVPIILAICMPFIPESPRWLVEHGKLEEARKALVWLRPDPAMVESELRDITAAHEAEERNAAAVTFWDMFRNPVDRRRTLLSVAAVSIQGATGAMYLIAYGTYFFEMAGVGQPFENSCILTAVGVVAITLSWFLITRVGRRHLILWGTVICGFVQLAVAVVYQRNPGTESTGKAIVGLSVIYLVAYNGGISAYCWLMGSEIPSQRLRSMTLGLAACVGFLEAWLAVLTAPYFINPSQLDWGPMYGYIWFPSCIVTAIVMYFLLPETKDRTLEELDEMFAARIPARDFRTYVCKSREEMTQSDSSSTTSPSEKEKSEQLELALPTLESV